MSININVQSQKKLYSYVCINTHIIVSMLLYKNSYNSMYPSFREI